MVGPKLTLAALAGVVCCAAACSSSSSPSDGKYLHLVLGAPADSSGCPADGGIETFSNEGELAEVAIYPAPSGAYFLATSAGLLGGSLSGSTYTFSGNIVDDTKAPGAPDSLLTQTVTWSLTLNGSAVSGSVSSELALTCKGGGADCAGFPSSDCTQTSPLIGSVLPGVDYLTPVGP